MKKLERLVSCCSPDQGLGAGRRMRRYRRSTCGPSSFAERVELELELIQPHMAQKPVLRAKVGCACVILRRSARALSVASNRGILSVELVKGSAAVADGAGKSGEFSSGGIGFSLRNHWVIVLLWVYPAMCARAARGTSKMC